MRRIRICAGRQLLTVFGSYRAHCIRNLGESTLPEKYVHHVKHEKRQGDNNGKAARKFYELYEERQLALRRVGLSVIFLIVHRR